MRQIIYEIETLSDARKRVDEYNKEAEKLHKQHQRQWMISYMFFCVVTFVGLLMIAVLDLEVGGRVFYGVGYTVWIFMFVKMAKLGNRLDAVNNDIERVRGWVKGREGKKLKFFS